MDTHTLDEIKERYYGPMGTDERDRIEHEIAVLHKWYLMDEMKKKHQKAFGEKAANAEII